MFARCVQQQTVTCMKSVKGAPNEATAEALLIGHESLWSQRLFHCIACFEVSGWVCERKKGTVPRRVTAHFIAKLEGLTQRQGVLSGRVVVSCSF